MSHHDRCSAERELSALRGQLDTIEESIKLANEDPSKADIEKDQAVESLYDLCSKAEELLASIQQDGLPYGRCGVKGCHHCKREAV